MRDGCCVNLHDDDLARLRAAELGTRHEHAMRDARVVRRQVRDAAFDMQAADDLFRAALEHLDDRALRLGRGSAAPSMRTAMRSPCMTSRICCAGR